MKRQSKRVIGTLPPEKLEEIRRVRETIEREEKPRIQAKLLAMQSQRLAAAAELSRVAELLKQERETQGKSLGQMQETTGITRSAICRLENLVDPNPTINTLNKIAEALGKKLIVALADQ